VFFIVCFLKRRFFAQKPFKSGLNGFFALVKVVEWDADVFESWCRWWSAVMQRSEDDKQTISTIFCPQKSLQHSSNSISRPSAYQNSRPNPSI
jgi:hypothetical protein